MCDVKMKKVELLSPAGNWAMLESAINNGADAVYLSGKKYGARAYADNFDNEQLKDAILYAHLYGVKVYVTINTLLYEDEIKECMDYIKFLYENNVDAVLMQDLGMINLVRQVYPDLEIHASTQMHNHNEEAINYLASLGIKRVVLARELSLDEIKKISTPIEKEVFVYGALCISYSGQCLLSSSVLKRSGNRGSCAGMCRLAYQLYEENKPINTDGEYLLSPKELNTLSHLREIIDSNIDSLKIEGRMKSPEYVGYVTKIFRRLIDAYYNNEEMNVTNMELTNLKKLYNRDFTLGHLFKERNYKLMNIKSSNHIGTHLGKATLYKNKIKIELDDDIYQYDGIRFSQQGGMIVNYLYDENFLLINHASKNSIVYVDNKISLTSSCEVLKTLDKHLMDTIKDIPKRKIPVNITVDAYIDKPFKATITDGINNITCEYKTVSKSNNCPVLKSEIVDKFSRLNDTLYHLQDIVVNCDKDIFIPVKFMNELRRTLVDSLTHQRTKPNKVLEYGNYKITCPKIKPTKSINFKVSNEEQLKYLLTKNVNIYTDDYILYKKYKQDNVFYITDKVAYTLPDLENENIVASNLSSVVKYSKNNNVVSDIYLNVTNSYSLETLHNLKATKIGLSIEASFTNIKNMINQFKLRNNELPNVDVTIYGRIELMVLKHCFLNMFLNKDFKCSVCKNKKHYYLKDRNKQFFPIKTKNCNTYILNYKNINMIDKIKDYQKLGINNFTLCLYDEDKPMIDKIYSSLQE